MGISLVKIAANIASVTLVVGDDTVTVAYYPGRVTEKVYSQLQAFSSLTNENVMAEFQHFNEMLAHLIKEWDVYEDEEQTVMFPIDPARFSELPLSFRVQVLQAIMGDIRPETIAPQS
jgi:hypothetical protein